MERFLPTNMNFNYNHWKVGYCESLYYVDFLATSIKPYIRAVMANDDIDVSIKKSSDIHNDTEIWISILIDIGSSKNCYFLPGGLHHGGLNQASILNNCMHQTF